MMTPTLRFRKVLAAALVVTALAACNNKSLPAAPQLPSQDTSKLFALSIGGSHSVAIGAKVPLKVEGAADDGAPVAVTATPVWKSLNTAIANVSAAGVVTGVKAGTVTIKANTASPDREATFEVRVLGPGETPPPDADISSSDSFATDPSVGPDGYTPTDGAGALPDGSGPSAPADVALAIYPSSPRVGVGERVRLVALQGPEGHGVPGAAVWRSSDTKIATVDEGGSVTGVTAGAVTITASSLAYPALRQTTRLTVTAPVKPADIKGIRISPSRVTMNVGETFWLLAEVPTNNGDFDPHVQWQVADESIATVSDTGQITARAPGKTTVRAIATTYDRGDLSAIVPVEVRNTSTSF
ncbi:MAG: hypothetical protein JWM80_5708 [Cyanobacteria bacterium RYN_339]|nr:hypothetical protein [Cyanobacteria bacterium RYN_339]